MAGEVQAVMHFASAALMLLLAVWLLRLDAANRAVRAFVALLILRAGVTIAARVADLDLFDARIAFSRAASVYQVGFVFATAAFLSVYPRRTRLAASRVWFPFLFLTAAATVVIALTVPCAIQCDELGVLGPLHLLGDGFEVLEAGGALALFLAAGREPAGSHRRVSILLVGVGLLTDAAASTAPTISSLVLLGPSALLSEISPSWLGMASIGARVVTFLLVLASMITWAIKGFPRTPTIIVWTTSVLTVAFWGRLDPDSVVRTLVAGAFRLALPLLAAYALARHRLFELDVRARRSLDKAAVGSVFAAIFFVVSEGVAAYLGNRIGVLAGIVVTALIIPLFPRLQRATEHALDAVVGPARSIASMAPEEKVRMYEDFARESWKDGSLSATERAFLDDLRIRLTLTFEEAALAESSAARRTAPQDGENPA